jgi:hypothetical protein
MLAPYKIDKNLRRGFHDAVPRNKLKVSNS